MIGTYISPMGTFTIKDQLKVGTYISPRDPMDIVVVVVVVVCQDQKSGALPAGRIGDFTEITLLGSTER